MEHNCERVVKWEPFPGLPRKLDTPSLTNDYDHGLRLILAEECANGRTFQVEFEKPLAFRSADESYRLKLIEPLQAELPWPTFKDRELCVGRMVSRPDAWNLPRLACGALRVHWRGCHRSIVGSTAASL